MTDQETLHVNRALLKKATYNTVEPLPFAMYDMKENKVFGKKKAQNKGEK